MFSFSYLFIHISLFFLFLPRGKGDDRKERVATVSSLSAIPLDDTSLFFKSLNYPFLFLSAQKRWNIWAMHCRMQGLYITDEKHRPTPSSSQNEGSKKEKWAPTLSIELVGDVQSPTPTRKRLSLVSYTALQWKASVLHFRFFFSRFPPLPPPSQSILCHCLSRIHFSPFSLSLSRIQICLICANRPFSWIIQRTVEKKGDIKTVNFVAMMIQVTIRPT